MSVANEQVLLGLSLQQLTAVAEGAGQRPYRAKQIFEALYRQRVQSTDQISTLPEALRATLQESGFQVGYPAIDRKFTSQDGTVRYLIKFADGQSVETVWMPQGDGVDPSEGGRRDVRNASSMPQTWDRATICVSSQVGCAVNCQFCLTAKLGVKRNLTAGEIVGQVLAVLNDQNVSPPQQRVNLVFMGMGEPFLNYDNFIQAVRLLVEGVQIPEARMTVSTAGIVPRIYDLGKESVRPRLAISLNAPNDAIREEIMPINRKWNLQALMTAAREYPLRGREYITFEYVVLEGVNDADGHARQVVGLLKDIRAKVNLIALNPGPGIDFRTPQAERVASFQQILIEAGIATFVRRPRGRDIFAACGQLKRTLDTGS